MTIDEKSKNNLNGVISHLMIKVKNLKNTHVKSISTTQIYNLYSLCKCL